MTRRRLRHGVILVSVREDGAALQEQPEPARELSPIAVEIVGPQLVDGDDHDESGAGRRRDPQQPQEQPQRSAHAHKSNEGQAASAVAGTGSPRGTRVAMSNASAMIAAHATNGTLGPRCW